MFPRNLNVFRFEVMPHGDIEARLADHRCREPGSMEFTTSGFVSPFGRSDDRLTIRSGPFVGFQYQAMHRDLRNQVVLDELAKEVEKIAESEGRKVNGRERRRIKDDVINRLLPHAPVLSRRVFGWFDPINGWLVLDVSSRRVAENVLSALREAFGSFPAVPLAPKEDPRIVMTHWLATGQLPKHLTLGDTCELRDTAALDSVVRCRRIDLDSDEVREHLRSGKQCFSAGLVYDDRISFVLTSTLAITGMRPLDVILDEQADSAESADAEHESNFALATLEMAGLLTFLEDTFKIPRPRSA